MRRNNKRAFKLFWVPRHSSNIESYSTTKTKKELKTGEKKREKKRKERETRGVAVAEGTPVTAEPLATGASLLSFISFFLFSFLFFCNPSIQCLPHYFCVCAKCRYLLLSSLLLPFFFPAPMTVMVHITADTDILVKISINNTDIVANTMWFFGVPRLRPIHSKLLVQLWVMTDTLIF